MNVISIGRYVVVRALARSSAPHARHYWEVRYGTPSGPLVCANLRSKRGAIIVALGREAEAKRVDRRNAREARSILGGCRG